MYVWQNGELNVMCVLIDRLIEKSEYLICFVMYMNVVVPDYILFCMFAIQLLYSTALFSSDFVNFGCMVGSGIKFRMGKWVLVF